MVTTSEKAGRRARGQGVRERKEGENRDAGLLGQTDGTARNPGQCVTAAFAL